MAQASELDSYHGMQLLKVCVKSPLVFVIEQLITKICRDCSLLKFVKSKTEGLASIMASQLSLFG